MSNIGGIIGSGSRGRGGGRKATESICYHCGSSRHIYPDCPYKSETRRNFKEQPKAELKDPPAENLALLPAAPPAVPGWDVTWDPAIGHVMTPAATPAQRSHPSVFPPVAMDPAPDAFDAYLPPVPLVANSGSVVSARDYRLLQEEHLVRVWGERHYRAESQALAVRLREAEQQLRQLRAAAEQPQQQQQPGASQFTFDVPPPPSSGFRFAGPVYDDDMQIVVDQGESSDQPRS